MDNEKENSVFAQDNNLYNKTIEVEPKPQKEIGVDTNGAFFQTIMDAASNGGLTMSQLESFTQVSQRRDQLYTLIDTMCQDSIVAAALETYAEDATEYNDQQQIVWVASDDDDVRHYVDYLLSKINVDKHIFEWVINLCRYGDTYIRLYRKSEYEDDDANELIKSRRALKESVKIKAYEENDHYAHYVEMMPNPAEYYELVRHGKTYGYVQAPVNSISKDNTFSGASIYDNYRYSFNQKDVTVYDATQFVHGSLYDNSTRTPEEVSIINGEDQEKKYTFKVRRGQSLLYNVFKIWREMSLLENAIILNRITKSSVVRVIQVQVGQMDKAMVGPTLQGVKQMFEQKSALNTDISMSEYTNPGPIENNIYIPVRGELGSISVQSVGGDNPNITGLADLDYFKNRFFGALRIPKQFLGDTSDAGGFDAGKSLAQSSSRYAKMVKRIQNTTINMITDMVNLMLIDADLESYIGKFTIMMLAPTTQEAADRQTAIRERVGIVQDVMQIVSNDVENEVTRLKILKSLLSSTIDNGDVLTLLQDEIDEKERISEEEVTPKEENDDFDLDSDLDSGGSAPSGGGIDLSAELGLDDEEGSSEADNSTEGYEDNNDIILPQPNSLGRDFTDIE